MAFLFEKLTVYQKAIDFADAVCDLTKGFPRGYFFLTDQLNRAALSPAACRRSCDGMSSTERPLLIGIISHPTPELRALDDVCLGAMACLLCIRSKAMM